MVPQMYQESDITAFVLIILAAVLYFIPTFVAFIRRHRQRRAILVLNIFLGFSYVGWVLALVWASKNE